MSILSQIRNCISKTKEARLAIINRLFSWYLFKTMNGLDDDRWECPVAIFILLVMGSSCDFVFMECSHGHLYYDSCLFIGWFLYFDV